MLKEVLCLRDKITRVSPALSEPVEVGKDEVKDAMNKERKISDANSKKLEESSGEGQITGKRIIDKVEGGIAKDCGGVEMDNLMRLNQLMVQTLKLQSAPKVEIDISEEIHWSTVTSSKISKMQ